LVFSKGHNGITTAKIAKTNKKPKFSTTAPQSLQHLRTAARVFCASSGFAACVSAVWRSRGESTRGDEEFLVVGIW